MYNSSKEEAEPETIKPDIDETKEFAKEFNKTRQSLGISQAQVVSALNTYQEPVFDESALNRFEQLDITPRSAARMKPVLERWLNDTALKFGDRLKSLNSNNQATSINTPNPSDQTASGGCNKKRKRFSFSPTTLKELNSEFTRNSQPTREFEFHPYGHYYLRTCCLRNNQCFFNTISSIKYSYVKWRKKS